MPIEQDPYVISGLIISFSLLAEADIHYGFMLRMKRGTSSKDLEFEPTTTEEEKAERAKVPFITHGVEFRSREDAIRVFKRFGEKYEDKIFSEDSYLTEVSKALKEIKQEFNIQ